MFRLAIQYFENLCLSRFYFIIKYIIIFDIGFVAPFIKKKKKCILFFIWIC